MRSKYAEVEDGGVLGCYETGIVIKGIAGGLQMLIDGKPESIKA